MQLNSDVKSDHIGHKVIVLSFFTVKKIAYASKVMAQLPCDSSTYILSYV